MPDTKPAVRHAIRVRQGQAEELFDHGATLVVSEYGHLKSLEVGTLTTTHHRTRTTWDTLLADVRMWRNRYPNQRFYVVLDCTQTDNHSGDYVEIYHGLLTPRIECGYHHSWRDLK